MAFSSVSLMPVVSGVPWARWPAAASRIALRADGLGGTMSLASTRDGDGGRVVLRRRSPPRHHAADDDGVGWQAPAARAPYAWLGLSSPLLNTATAVRRWCRPAKAHRRKRLNIVTPSLPGGCHRLSSHSRLPSLTRALPPLLLAVLVVPVDAPARLSTNASWYSRTARGAVADLLPPGGT